MHPQGGTAKKTMGNQTTSTRTVYRNGSLAPDRFEHISDDELLQLRFCDLKLRIEGTFVQEQIERVRGELADRNLNFRPRCWLSNDWFSPDDFPGIAVPFYLAHPRLTKLERKMMLEAEGSNKRWCRRLLRHETGHAIQVAYRLHRRVRWQKLFGRASKPYPDYYSPKPFSRRYVLHLDWWYAQSHPCEDFAETFAVWLTPGFPWRRRYKDWPALKKLEYVDELMEEIAGKKPLVTSRATMEPLHTLTETLGEYYQQKRTRYESSYPDFYDRDLRRLFADNGESKKAMRASTFLTRRGPKLCRQVAEWTGEHSYTVSQVLKEMANRCKELDLHVHRPVEELTLDTVILLTMQVTHYLHSDEHRLAL